MEKLREAPDNTLPHSILLKRMKMDAKGFRELIETLIQSGDVAVARVVTPGRTGVAYSLTEG